MKVFEKVRAAGGLTIPTFVGATPNTGEVALYSKGDGYIYQKNDAGVESLVGNPISPGSDAPVGAIFAFAGSTAPTGFMIADGTAISRTSYAELFAMIGTTFGVGDGSTTFNLPNMKGRVLVGRDAAQTEFDVLGETGGAKTHTLTAAEIPGHVHGQTGFYTVSTSHSHSGVGGGAAEAPNPSNGAASGMGNTTSTGGGGAHNNLQPYLVGNYIIKVSNIIGGRLPNQIIEMSVNPHTAANGWSKVPLAQTNATLGSNMTVASNGITINTSGYYRIDANVMWDGGTTGRRIARIIGAASSGAAASGAPTLASSDMKAQDTTWFPAEVLSVTRFIAAGTHLRLEVYQDSGGTLSNTSSHMTVEALFTNPADVEDTGWVDLTTFYNSWTNFDGAGGRKAQIRRIGNHVKHRGIIKSGATGDAWLIPVGFRPEIRTSAEHYLPCVSNTAFGAVAVWATSGIAQVAAGSNVWFDISGVDYFIN